jgi:FSR family fosmidomycin resistance protein-like MFS transporter
MPQEGGPLGAALGRGAREALRALRRREVLRWLALLEIADLLLDVLHAYLALYFVDVVGVSGARAGLAVAVWTGVGLLGDALLIPLLARVRGTSYLRVSALVVLAVYPAFLLVAEPASKLALLGALGLLNAGWYAILKARLYEEMAGQSATVMTLGNVFGLAGSLLPLLMGFAAERYGLGAAMWLPLLAPVGLLVGVPRRAKAG